MSLVGKNIDSLCTKCKLLLAHIVMYEVAGAVSRVKCKTCGSEHRYKREKPPISRSGPAPRSRQEMRGKTVSASRKAVNDVPVRWELRQSEMNPEIPVKTYRIQDIFKLKDVIRHPVFGLGFVERVISETRMDVLFKDAVKLMAMNTRPVMAME